MICSLLLLVFSVDTVGKTLEKSENIIELTDSTLKGILQSRASTLFIIEGYAPWCVHCQAYAPFIAKAANNIAKLYSPKQIQINRLNCDEFQSSCELIKVSGFPSVFAYYHGSQSSEFTGDRSSEEATVKWITSTFEAINSDDNNRIQDTSLFSSFYLKPGKKHSNLFKMQVLKVESMLELMNDPWLIYNCDVKSGLLDSLSSRFNGLLKVGYGNLSSFAPKRPSCHFLFFLKTSEDPIMIPYDSHVIANDDLYQFALKALLITYPFDSSAFKLAGYELNEIQHSFSSIFRPLSLLNDHSYMVLFINLDLIKDDQILTILQAMSEQLDTYDFYPIGISVLRPSVGSRLNIYTTHDQNIAHRYLNAEMSHSLDLDYKGSGDVAFTLCSVSDLYSADKPIPVNVKCLNEVNFSKIRSFTKHQKQFDIIETTPLNVANVLSSKAPLVLALIDPYIHTKLLSTMYLSLAHGTRSGATGYFIDAWYFKEYSSIIFDINYDTDKLPIILVVKDKKYYKPETNLDLINGEFTKIHEFISTLVDKSGFQVFKEMTVSAKLGEDQQEEIVARDEGGYVPYYGLMLIILIGVVVYFRKANYKSYGRLPTHNKFA
eukprot:NODE_169_length_16247_cov_0.185348.p2 type:complete len:604 gc:universal NODE_169_length_16247_cov_0.185348:14700-12889(-)